MEGLGFDNILSGDEVSAMFSDENIVTEVEEPKDDDDNKNEDNNDTAEGLGIDFGPEGVGGNEETDDKGGASPSGDDGTPNKKHSSIAGNTWSSLAKALKDEGVFPDLSDDDIENTKDASAFRKIFEDQNSLLLDERQKRIEKYMSIGADPDAVAQDENILVFLSKITDDALSKDDEQGEQLRRQLIEQDFINKNFSAERVKKMVDKIFEDGSDVEYAKDALAENKKFYQDRHKSYLEGLENQKKSRQQEEQKKQEQLKKRMLESNDFLGGMAIDKAIRQKAYDTLTKFTYKDNQSGKYMTALQKYQIEHPDEFAANMSLMYVLTDGFKKMENFTKKQVREGMKKGFSELEHVLNNTRRNGSGTLNFASGEDGFDDNRENWTLAI